MQKFMRIILVFNSIGLINYLPKLNWNIDMGRSFNILLRIMRRKLR